ncbi:MAG: type II toxin-antitoxin system RelE/ParE family toxin [Ilumatobacteraceae bacterium]
MTTALLRPLAEADLIARTRFYGTEGGDGLGERFFDAAVAALDALTRMPGAGSPHVGELCGIPDLRVRRLIGFPCGWFYFIANDHVDIVRLLADAQDLPGILADVVHE